MKDHRKKMIAPVIITVLTIIYFIFYFWIIVSSTEPAVIKALMGIIPAVLSIVSIAVCVQRIREIKSGEEDDLYKY